MKKAKYVVFIFLEISHLVMMKFSMLPWPAGFMKLIFSLYYIINIQRRDLGDVMKNILNLFSC